jgi:hypothetical protein
MGIRRVHLMVLRKEFLKELEWELQMEQKWVHLLEMQKEKQKGMRLGMG